MTKTGRNDLCPCGSGKKFKKCCGPAKNNNLIKRQPADITLSAGEYDDALEVVTEYFDSLSVHDEDAQELRAQAAWFFLLYEPGTELGVPDSVFMPWLYFDVPFGSSKQTLLERLIKSPLFITLSPKTQTAIHHLSLSYPAFYKIVSQESASFVCREIGTNRKWTVVTDEDDDIAIDTENELLYMRLLGSYDNACMFDTPWLIGDDVADDLLDLFGARWAHEQVTSNGSSDDACEFRVFNKTLSSFWIGYVNGQIEMPPDGDHLDLLNTEGHPLLFCDLFFTINNKESLVASLTASSDFEYNEDDDMWIWSDLVEEYDEFSDYLPPDIADVHIEDKMLICNANSMERIERLRTRIEEIAPDAVFYEKTDTQELKLNTLDMSESIPKTQKKRRHN